MGQPAPVLCRTWSFRELDAEERETVIFLRRLMRKLGKQDLGSVQINDEINAVRQELERQREVYRVRRRSWWWFVLGDAEDVLDPDTCQFPLVATDDGWRDFMLALERLRSKRIIRELSIAGNRYICHFI